MIRNQYSDFPPLTADLVCVIANYRLIDLSNVRMFVRGANCEGLLRLRVAMRNPTVIRSVYITISWFTISWLH